MAEKVKKVVLLKYMLSRFLSSHSTMFFKATSAFVRASGQVLPRTSIAVSSAYVIILQLLISRLHRSFI